MASRRNDRLARSLERAECLGNARVDGNEVRGGPPLPVELRPHQGCQIAGGKRSRRIGLRHRDARERRHERLHDAGGVLVGERGDEERRPGAALRRDLPHRSHERVARLRIVAGIDHEKRVAREHVEATGRGARSQARIEQRFVEGCPRYSSAISTAQATFCALVSGR